MRIALAQYDFTIGDIEGNRERILEGVREALHRNAELVIFPELAICGYPPQDLLQHDAFIQRCLEAIEAIAEECHGVAAIVGGPSFVEGRKDRKRYNSAFFLNEGQVQKVQHKTLLPDYDVFDEERHFVSAPSTGLIEYGGERLALTICEDIWDIREELDYPERSPAEVLAEKDPTLLINIAASPFDHEHAEKRREVMEGNVARCRCPLFYVANVGGQTDLIFDGGSMVLNENGEKVKELGYFREGLELVETKTLEGNSEMDPLPGKEERIRQALTLGIQDFFKKLGLEKAVLGLSGGIDSALTLTLVVDALGPEHVLAVMMPSEFSSEHSVTDSERLIENLGCQSRTHSIQEIFGQFQSTLAPSFEGRPFDVTEENIQARIRGTLLMALSNKFGHLLLNTTNKSEMAVGYGTLYGDLCGGLSVIGDLYKTEAYELAAHLNRNGERIPQNILEKPPSAELKPDQKDTDSLPPYELLDRILYRYIEDRRSLKEIVKEGFDEETVRDVIGKVDKSEFKRYQSAPVLRISRKAFGTGRRMPLVRSFREPGGA